MMVSSTPSPEAGSDAGGAPLRLQADGVITRRFVTGVRERIAAAKPVHRSLPERGRIHVDRPLPFLVVYRRPAGRDDPGTERLVTGEAAHLVTSGDRRHRAGVSDLVEGVVEEMSRSFGAVLVIEVWASRDDPTREGSRAEFRIARAKGARLQSTANVLDAALSEVKIKGELAEVASTIGARPSPPGMPPIISTDRAAELNCELLGLEVRPIFRDLAKGETYPLIRRALHRGVSRAIQRAVFDFTRKRTSHRPAHYQALGRRGFVKALWDADAALAKVSGSFDFLLQVTPTNVDEAWVDFRRRRFESEPDFASRPLRVDPAIRKRELFKIPLERIEDPTLSQLLRDQQTEIDRKLTMLADRGTPRFLYGSLQIYGGVDAPLLAAAYEILQRIPPRSRDESLRDAVSAAGFAARAEEEIAYYREIVPDMSSRVEIRDDVAALTVSRGNLLVPARAKIPISRVEALIAHEVGTHIVTYANGRAQRLKQLSVGLPGYEELQEGLAVFAEYLVGGMSRPRLRLLAARVVATHRMIEGATFVEVFRELDRAHDFAQRTAFGITMRVFRGGGFTKDVSYLRGLLGVLNFLKEGGDFERLLVGKFGPEHILLVEELRWRKILVDAPIRPKYLDDLDARDRLAAARMGLSVFDLVSGSKGR